MRGTGREAVLVWSLSSSSLFLSLLFLFPNAPVPKYSSSPRERRKQTHTCRTLTKLITLSSSELLLLKRSVKVRTSSLQMFDSYGKLNWSIFWTFETDRLLLPLTQINDLINDQSHVRFLLFLFKPCRVEFTQNAISDHVWSFPEILCDSHIFYHRSPLGRISLALLCILILFPPRVNLICCFKKKRLGVP